METDLSIRLHEYSAATEALAPGDAGLYADALAASLAAAAAAGASVICSHTRLLRGDSPPAHLLPGQDELEILIAGKSPAKPSDPPDAQTAGEPHSEAPPDRIILPLPPGEDSLDKLVLGAAGIPAIKSPNA